MLKVFPLSGRTNQIRVHLASVALPIVNDSVYGQATGPIGQYGLHALRLGFKFADREMDLTAQWPEHLPEKKKTVGEKLL